MLLEDAGYSVATAGSLEAGRAAGRRSRPDLVLLDLTLPDGDGLLLASEWPDGARPVIVALTGHADDQTRDRCLEAGCDRVLVKPIASALLLANVAELLAE